MLATLVSIMMLATMIGLVQMRSAANQRLAATLAADLRDSLARDALFERLRGLVADQMTALDRRADRPALDGRPFALTQAGNDWLVEVQDVNALVDIYFSASPILERVVPDLGSFLSERTAILEAIPPGTRFPRLAMSLARFGLDPATRGLYTQSGRSGQIRAENAPRELAGLLTSLPAGLILQGQVETVAVRIDRVR